MVTLSQFYATNGKLRAFWIRRQSRQMMSCAGYNWVADVARGPYRIVHEPVISLIDGCLVNFKCPFKLSIT